MWSELNPFRKLKEGLAKDRYLQYSRVEQGKHFMRNTKERRKKNKEEVVS